MLTSVQNPLIKQVRKLHNSKERHKQNLHLLEGTNLISVALEVSYPLVTVLTTELWQKKNLFLWEKLQSQGERVETVSEEVMTKLATTVNPDGVVATAKRDSVVSHPRQNLQLGLILDRIQDPGNLGTIIRSSVAMGVDFIWLSRDCVDLDNPKVMRASVGEWFKIKAKVENNLSLLITEYQEKGYQIIATDLQGDIKPWQVDLTAPTIILMGNESRGLSANLKNLATHKLKIPLFNGVESLNVAIASSLILHERMRQIEVRG
ncbi:RNA methyltransferase [Cyanobacterium aponinum UTEX 3221]|uniref:TrmH family RNA methyltransferase n=1 Tax=Cyanobacterium aponinum TaxID=379064 RepID=UPI002B4C192B|nr:RNA methyltransferase [Cyanobacterium aponinum]WRL39718.1 RNA methyltransferase [Cyanobacterium aponinum UTEX 3221]